MWVPDAVDEAVRDPRRRREEPAADDLRRKRQQLLSFLLRRGRTTAGEVIGRWRYRRWLAKKASKGTAAQQMVFQEGIDAIEDAVQRLHRLEQQLAAIVPSWSMAPAVAAYQAMRGASFLVAVTFAAEIGDVRRFDTPRQLMSFLGLVPAVELHWRHRTTQGPNPGRQSTCPPGIGRGCLDIPLSRQGQRNPESPHRGIAEDGARHRLESAAPTVCSLLSAEDLWQEAARGGGSHCS